ncbi:MAG: ATP-grasp domain-containing protein [Lacipirellulaceae bacterium]
MHVFLYEWVTGGGLVNEGGRLPDSLLAEGSAMVSALAEDFLNLEDSHVTVLRDLRLESPTFKGCEVVEVHSGTHRDDLLEEYATTADFTLAIAPEFDRQLELSVSILQSGDSRSLNALPEFLGIAANKRQTAEKLREFEIPVPESTLHAADEERLPRDFSYPAVLKPIDGAGSQHTLLIEGHLDAPEPHPWPRLLERFIPGRPASVLFICGPNGTTALPPCWQRLCDSGRFAYLGGSIIMQKSLAERAQQLALRALAALPPANGFVGVDLVLGEAEDGSGDYVIEINPRLTTSYVGLRKVVKENLAGLAIKAAKNELISVTQRDVPLEFTSDGNANLL